MKKWLVTYDHKDGRKGEITATTEIQKSGAFQYGNGKAGRLVVGESERFYDLRYEHGGDNYLQLLMIQDYFGKGLVDAEEIT